MKIRKNYKGLKRRLILLIKVLYAFAGNLGLMYWRIEYIFSPFQEKYCFPGLSLGIFFHPVGSLTKPFVVEEAIVLWHPE